MKVIRNTPTQLIVENKPLLLSLLLGVMAVLGFGAALFLMLYESLLSGLFVFCVSAVIFPVTLYFVVQRVQVLFDAQTNTMILRTRTFLGHTEITHALHHLSHAEIDTSHAGKTKTPTHCPIFVLSGGMSAGRHPMTPTYQSGRGPQRIVDAVNAWLTAARASGNFPAPVDSNAPEA